MIMALLCVAYTCNNQLLYLLHVLLVFIVSELLAVFNEYSDC